MARLLTADLTKRLGNLKNGADDVKKHKWFAAQSFADLEEKKIAPPIKPEVGSESDTGNFEKYPDSEEGSTQPIDARDQALFEDF